MTAHPRTPHTWVTATAVLLLAIPAGCTSPASQDDGFEAPANLMPELVAAIDQNPDPRIVEVTLVATAAQVEYLPGVMTQVLAYRDGSGSATASVPGPLIVANVGDTVRVHFVNELTESTTVHWHGLRIPFEMDGNPMVSGSVQPGGRFEYEFVVPDAALFWYHPHVRTDTQMEMGLLGPMLIRDPDAPQVARERIFVFDDVELTSDGTQVVLEPSKADIKIGRRGNHFLINGKPPAAIVVEAGRTERWRIVNTANSRYLRLALDNTSFEVIGGDGGLADASYVTEELLIAPGERFDVLVTPEGSVGDHLSLQTLEVARGHDMVDPGPFELVDVVVGPAVDGADPEATAIFERTVDALVPDPEPPRRFVLGEMLDSPVGTAFTINDQRWPLNTAIDVKLGAVDTWEIVNDNDGDHPFHIHGLFFQVLDVGGQVPRVRQWKDTVPIPPNTTARLAVRYGLEGMWMFHCQIPEHAERGMTGDLRVSP